MNNEIPMTGMRSLVPVFVVRRVELRDHPTKQTEMTTKTVASFSDSAVASGVASTLNETVDRERNPGVTEARYVVETVYRTEGAMGEDAARHAGESPK